MFRTQCVQSLAEDVIQGGVYENADTVEIFWMLFQSVGLVQHGRCSWQSAEEGIGHFTSNVTAG